MTLKLLIVEDEPELEIQHIPLSSTEEVEPDMELPGEFLVQDDLDLLQDSAMALESIGRHAACEGMDVATARELEKLCPGFMRKNGGHGSFTSRPSLEGLSSGIAAVRDKFFEIIQTLRKRVAQMYTSFMAWLHAKFSKAEAQDTAEDLNEFLSQTRERNAIAYLSSLPEAPNEAADEVARFMDGDTKAFAADLTDKLQSLVKRMAAMQEAMEQNPTHFRLAKGLVTVEQLFKEDDSSSIREVVGKAFKAAEAAMKARNKHHFFDAMEDIDAVSAEIDQFKEGATGNSDETGEDASVSYEKLFDNIAKAAEDMKKVSVQQKVAEMSENVKRIIQISEGTKLEEILEMIPEDVPAEQHHEFAQKVATFYRKIAKLGSVILVLWRARSDAIASINKVGSELMGLKDGFEKAVVSAGASLTPEQKTQLTKALVGKGLKIVF